MCILKYFLYVDICKKIVTKNQQVEFCQWFIYINTLNVILKSIYIDEVNFSSRYTSDIFSLVIIVIIYKKKLNKYYHLSRWFLVIILNLT